MIKFRAQELLGLLLVQSFHNGLRFLEIREA